MTTYCIHCGIRRPLWAVDPRRGHDFPVIGSHTTGLGAQHQVCPGSLTPIVPDDRPALSVRWLHADACLTPTGITCVCPLEAPTTSTEETSDVA